MVVQDSNVQFHSKIQWVMGSQKATVMFALQ